MNSDDTMTDTDTGVEAPTVADGLALERVGVHDQAVLTALEILSTEIGPDGSLLVPMLLVLMFVKFWIVASFFMHLRFDSRLFSFLFYLGLGAAVVLYCAVLATFHFWTS